MISFTQMTLTKQSVNSRSSRSEVFCEKRVLKFFANTYAGAASFLIKLQGSTLVKKRLSPKDTPGQVFSYEFCERFKNTYFYIRNQASGIVLKVPEILKFLSSKVS